jgi:SAM-dependent methyltransferase
MTAIADLLTHFVARYPAQPATAYWRAIEIDVLAQAGIPDGLGLDLGCGDGILTDILFQRMGRTPNLVGIDPDPLETAAAAKYDFYSRIHTCPGNAIPEADGIFDYVISNSVLEHIPDLEPVIAEVGRLLKPGGRFFYTVPAPGFHENLVGSLSPFTTREDYLVALDKRLAHFNYLAEGDWADLCGRHGMTIDPALGYLNQGETQRWETLSRWTGGLLHSLTGGSSRPIEIQRTLNLRAFQNSAALPSFIAGGIAAAIGDAGKSAADAPPSCLLITGTKTAASKAATKPRVSKAKKAKAA